MPYPQRARGVRPPWAGGRKKGVMKRYGVVMEEKNVVECRSGKTEERERQN